MEPGAEEPPRFPSRWPLVILPAVVVGSIFVMPYFPDFVSDLYDDFGFEFLLSVWLGQGFAFTWSYLRASMHAEKFPPAMVAATGVLSGLVLLSMVGFETLWEDPWLFGVAVVPGFQLARPYLMSMLSGREQAAASDDVAGQ